MYDLQPVTSDPAEVERTAALLRDTFRDPRFTPAYLQWMYFDNPDGAAVGFNAMEGAELAAHYVTLPVEARVAGVLQRGLLSLNTATHPRHQGRKLFTRLAEATYAAAAERGYEFVMGVANANSTPGFIGKLGFQLICPLEARLGFGAIAEKEAQFGFARVWSEAALEWRLSRPSFDYTTSKWRTGSCVYGPTDKPGIKVLLYRAASGEPLPRRDGRQYRPLTLYLGVDARLDWSKSAFFTVPGPLRPSPLNLILKGLGAANLPRERAAFLVQGLDFDAY